MHLQCSYIVSKPDKHVPLQETTVQLMWMSVSLLHVSMKEAARIWSTPINVCVQMVSKVGVFPYFPLLILPQTLKLGTFFKHMAVQLNKNIKFTFPDLLGCAWFE